MAARKKTARKKPAPRAKPASKSGGTARKPRKLPDDDAWRELVATAVAKPEPSSGGVSTSPPGKAGKAAKKK